MHVKETSSQATHVFNSMLTEKLICIRSVCTTLQKYRNSIYEAHTILSNLV